MKRSDLLLLAVVALLAVPVYRGLSRPSGSVRPPPAAPAPPSDDISLPPGAGDEDDFGRNTLARYDAYSDGGANWEIGGGVLTGAGPAGQAVLIRRDVRFADGWAEAESARADDGGLVLRFQDPEHYYLLAFRDDGAPEARGASNLALYHRVGGEYRELGRADVRWPRGTPHTIRFKAAGPWLLAFFDDEPRIKVLTTTNRADREGYSGPGGVGVRSDGADASWASQFTTFRWQRFGMSWAERTRPGAPRTIRTCEWVGADSACGTWTLREGTRYDAAWDDGARATVTLERWAPGDVRYRRQDVGSRGTTAVYTGSAKNYEILGTVTRIEDGRHRTGFWHAEW